MTPTMSPFYYTGMPFDGNGLSYHNARYFDPVTGNWISQDPLELGNRYIYVDQNPVNDTDLSGLIPDSLAFSSNSCSVNQTSQQATVHVPCGGPPAKVRSHPSFYGGEIGEYAPGTVLNVCERRADSPTNGLAPAHWVRVVSGTDSCANSQTWIRATDGTNPLIQDGPPVGCNSLQPTPLHPAPSGSFSYGSPGCSRGGSCIEGHESIFYQLAFILACESAAGGYLGENNLEEMRQAMVDIAYVIRSRVRSGGFPDSPLDVIRQDTAFQCYTEGSGSDLSMAISQASPIAEALGAGQPLPPPSFPELEYALFFFGLPWQEQANATANTISRADVTSFFSNSGIVGISASTLDGIYLGHGPMNSNTFGTFFFSDDPQFTGYIP
jgi:RHS repeat-associated protein